MAPIPLKGILSVSSEDPLNPAISLLGTRGPVGGKWLCAVDDKTRRCEVVIELAKRSKITNIEIGNFGSAFVEVLVSSLDSQADYTTLLQSSMLRSIPDSKSGRGKTTTLRCGRDKLSKSAIDKKWTLVKIVVSQKYNFSEQFGLQFVRFGNDTPITHTPHHHSTPLTPTPLTPSARHATPTTPKIPSLSSARTPTGHAQRQQNGSTPRRATTKGAKKEDFEFAGLEKQSRLFKNCVRGKEGKTESNSILNKIRADREKYSEHLLNSPTYTTTKRLKKELPKADTMKDYVDSFNKDSLKTTPVSIKSTYDDQSEIGSEGDRKWGRRDRKHSKPTPPSGWLSKRRKILNQDDTIIDLQVKENTPQKSSEPPAKLNFDLSEATPGGNHSNKTSSEDSMVECPLCGVLLPGYVIQVHASSCGEVAMGTLVTNPLLLD